MADFRNIYHKVPSGTLADPGANGIIKRTALNTTAPAVAGTDYEAALGFTPENVADKGAANGYAPLNSSGIVPTANLPVASASGLADPGSNGVVKRTALDVTAPAGPSDIISALGYTPENYASKGATNGYAPLVSGLVPIAHLGTGTPTGAKFVRDDGILAVPASLLDPGANGVMKRTGPNVTAPAVPNVDYMPAVAASGMLKVNSGNVGLATPGADFMAPVPGASGLVQLSGGSPAIATATNVESTLGFTPENVANKGANSGYAPLGSTGLVPMANLATGPHTGLSFVKEDGTLQIPPTGLIDPGANGIVKRTAFNITAPAIANSDYMPAVSGSGVLKVSAGTVALATPGADFMAAVPGASGLVQLSGGAPAIATATNVESTLGFTPENVANKGANNGYAPLGSTGLVPMANLATGAHTGSSFVKEDGTLAIPASNALADPGFNGIVKRTALNVTAPAVAGTDYQAPLGYTAEDAAFRGANNGYAPLDSSGIVPLTNLPAPNVDYMGVVGGSGLLKVVGGIPTLANAGSDYAPISGGVVPVVYLATGTPTGTKFIRDDGTLAVPPGTGGGGGVADPGANGIMKRTALDVSAPAIANSDYMPAVSGSGVLKVSAGTVTLATPGADFMAAVPGASGLVQLSGGAPAIATATNVESTLGFTPENVANKGANNGYAPLGSTGLVPMANLATGAHTGSSFVKEDGTLAIPASMADPGSNGLMKRTALNVTAPAVPGTDYQAPLGFYAENVANKGAASGYAPLNSSSLVPMANLAMGTPNGTQYVRDDGTLAVPSIGTGLDQITTITMSTADIAAMLTTPKLLLTAQGAGTMIEVVSLLVKYIYLSTPFTQGGNWCAVYGAYGTGGQITTAFGTYLFAVSYSGIAVAYPVSSMAAALANYVNAGVYLQQVTGINAFTGGGGSAIVQLTYRVHTGL